MENQKRKTASASSWIKRKILIFEHKLMTLHGRSCFASPNIRRYFIFRSCVGITHVR